MSGLYAQVFYQTWSKRPIPGEEMLLAFYEVFGLKLYRVFE